MSSNVKRKTTKAIVNQDVVTTAHWPASGTRPPARNNNNSALVHLVVNLDTVYTHHKSYYRVRW